MCLTCTAAYACRWRDFNYDISPFANTRINLIESGAGFLLCVQCTGFDYADWLLSFAPCFCNTNSEADQEYVPPWFCHCLSNPIDLWEQKELFIIPGLVNRKNTHLFKLLVAASLVALFAEQCFFSDILCRSVLLLTIQLFRLNESIFCRWPRMWMKSKLQQQKPKNHSTSRFFSLLRRTHKHPSTHSPSLCTRQESQVWRQLHRKMHSYAKN